MQSKTPLLYNKDFYEWSRSWMGFEKDIEVGDKIIQEFVPFIESLVQKNLARSTIKKYMADLWVLGGEIIRGIHNDEHQRKWTGREILLHYINDVGGPLPHCWNPNEFTEQRYMTAYDSVCRILYKFIKSSN